MPDRQFAVSGKWALAADRLQWMLQRQRMHKGRVDWHSVSFVASTKDVLARCMREKGCPPAGAAAGRPAGNLPGMGRETGSGEGRDGFGRRVSLRPLEAPVRPSPTLQASPIRS